MQQVMEAVRHYLQVSGVSLASNLGNIKSQTDSNSDSTNLKHLDFTQSIISGMALALETAAPLKPKVRLAQAISEFEADLTTQQKIQFGSYKQRVRKFLPGISDVMRLTAEIDQKTSLKVTRSRCYGPRFTNFLQAVQQFIGLGDIIVGGTQNLIACGV